MCARSATGDSDNKCVQIDPSGDGRNGTRLVVGCNEGIAIKDNLWRLTAFLFEFYFGEVDANLW